MTYDLKKKKRRWISAVSIFRNPTLQIDVSPGQNRVRPFLNRTRLKVNNGHLSCGYFQFCTDYNAVALQTVGRFKGFHRCSVGFGNTGQAIAGFDHIKCLGLAGGPRILPGNRRCGPAGCVKIGLQNWLWFLLLHQSRVCPRRWHIR